MSFVVAPYATLVAASAPRKRFSSNTEREFTQTVDTEKGVIECIEPKRLQYRKSQRQAGVANVHSSQSYRAGYIPAATETSIDALQYAHDPLDTYIHWTAVSETCLAATSSRRTITERSIF